MRAAAIALVLVGASVGTAQAFPTGVQFDSNPLTEDGGGGIAFNGAPRWAGHTCDVCHTNPDRTVGIRLESDHPELFTAGWKAGQQYHLRVVLLNDHAGLALKANKDNCGFSVMPYKACDENGFSLELDDAHGKPVGKFVPVAVNVCDNAGTAPPDVDVRVMMDGTAVTHTGAHMAMTQWDLCWTAPGSGTGSITAYVAAVDGNGGSGTLAFPTDSVGDDVASGAVPIPELGAVPPAQMGGCAATSDPDRGALIAVGILAIAFALRRRRLRIAALLAIVAITGCAHVRPRQRETLAKRKMTFAPDGTEDELDLHMQESREGSSGGYGSSGGGCGCN